MSAEWRCSVNAVLVQCSQPLPDCLQSILLPAEFSILKVRVPCSLRAQTAYTCITVFVSDVFLIQKCCLFVNITHLYKWNWISVYYHHWTDISRYSQHVLETANKGNCWLMNVQRKKIRTAIIRERVCLLVQRDLVLKATNKGTSWNVARSYNHSNHSKWRNSGNLILIVRYSGKMYVISPSLLLTLQYVVKFQWNPPYFSRTFMQLEPSCYMRIDGRTDRHDESSLRSLKRLREHT
jgi:hypothetical protein